jgi:hypothetical protein
MEELPRLSSVEEIEAFRIARTVTSTAARRMAGLLPHACVLPALKLLGALLTDSARLRLVIRECLVRLSIDIWIDIETRVSVDISTQVPQQYLNETTISLYVCFIFNIRHSSND